MRQILQTQLTCVQGEDSRKRPRTAFSVEQVRVLEQEFQRNKYLSMGKRVDISKQLGLTEQQVRANQSQDRGGSFPLLDGDALVCLVYLT